MFIDLSTTTAKQAVINYYYGLCAFTGNPETVSVIPLMIALQGWTSQEFVTDLFNSTDMPIVLRQWLDETISLRASNYFSGFIGELGFSTGDTQNMAGG